MVPPDWLDEDYIVRLDMAVSCGKLPRFKRICRLIADFKNPGDTLRLMHEPIKKYHATNIASLIFLTKYNSQIVEYLFTVLGMNIEHFIPLHSSKLKDIKDSYLHMKESSPLWVACFSGHIEVVRFLINFGAKPNAIGKPKYFHSAGLLKRSTPLHVAVHQGHLDVVEFLVREGRAELGAVTGSGYTCLMIACLKENVEMIRLLIRLGADVNQTNSSGRNVLHVAVTIENVANKCSNTDETPKFLKILEILLENGAQLKFDATGRSPLTEAAARYNQMSFKLLLTENRHQWDRNDVAAAEQIASDHSQLESDLMKLQHDQCSATAVSTWMRDNKQPSIVEPSGNEQPAHKYEMDECDSVRDSIVEWFCSRTLEVDTVEHFLSSIPPKFLPCRMRLLMSLMEGACNVLKPFHPSIKQLLKMIVSAVREIHFLENIRHWDENNQISVTCKSWFYSMILKFIDLVVLEIERGVNHIDQVADYTSVLNKNDVFWRKTRSFLKNAIRLSYFAVGFQSHFNQEQNDFFRKSLRRLVDLHRHKSMIQTHILIKISTMYNCNLINPIEFLNLKNLFAVLLQSGADGNEVEEYGRTIIDQMAYKCLNELTKSEFVSLVCVILENTGEQLLYRSDYRSLTEKCEEFPDDLCDVVNPFRFRSLKCLSARAMRMHWTYENIRNLPKLLFDLVFFSETN